ncbi:hypothetical protein Lal_00042177 [Lupinus albus]|nr:hypothetical protein Lal_00042177 [Lupinus albus]
MVTLPLSYDRFEVDSKELEKGIKLIKGTCNQEHFVHPEDGQQKGSSLKGGDEVPKKRHHCHFPNSSRIDHDSRNCPTKRKKILHYLLIKL